MTGQIFKNEWQFFSRNKTLLGVTISFVLVLVLSIALGNIQTKNQTVAYQTAQEHLRAQWENIDAMNPHSAAHYGTYVFKPANLLSSLDEGVNSITGNVLRVEGHVQNEIVHSEASQMQTVSKFGKLKSSLLLQYIVPLLLIFLAFNSVSSEKQSGRLKLLVLQGAKVKSILWAKTLSVWLYGIVLLAVVVVVYALLNIQNLNTDTISRSLLFFLSYAMYYFIISGLTVFFSARWQNATVALTSMLGIWILWTVFLPNIWMSSAEQLHELPSRNEFQAAMKEDRSKGLDGHNPADERSKGLEEQVLKEYGVDSLSQLPINFDGLVMQADEEYGNQVWDKHFGNLREVLTKQKQTYQWAGLVNPFVSLQNASMGFTASDNLHHQEFLVQVEHYRRDFIKTLNDKHAYGGSKTGDWGWKADNDFFKSVPDFKYQPTALSTIFSNYITDLLLLILWSVLVVVLLVTGTKKIELI
ncbi:ABC transporter permease [Paucihalobacter sp.]|uniref:ABC transporter permease n=1 Tax=Paucihalobacter sp. TaxID=2850405 RepID=UPI002FE27C95